MFRCNLLYKKLSKIKYRMCNFKKWLKIDIIISNDVMMINLKWYVIGSIVGSSVYLLWYVIYLSFFL